MQAFVETNIPMDRAVLVSVQLRGVTREETEESIAELSRLADTAGIEVVGKAIHTRQTPHVAYYIGEGKAQEIKALVDELQADVMIFDDELSPAQSRNLGKLLECTIIDRTGLILEIFAQRAQTREAMVQVDLAQLHYALPRLTHQWTHLGRLGGGSGSGVKGGVGTRGAGETQLQIDRQLVRTRISQLGKELKKIQQQRQTQRKHRADVPSVALVGYTNAGKSTLLNSLTNEDVLVEDKLFATLDPTTRSMGLQHGRRVLLSDTVGFIHKLPHQLVASFRATLEEVVEADLLLHVLDASHPRALVQATSVHAVLEELSVDDKPRWMVFNKLDQVQDPSVLSVLRLEYPESIDISALTGFGLDDLNQRLSEHFASLEVEFSVVLSHRDGKAMDYLYRHGEVLERDYEANDIHLRARMSEAFMGRFRTMVQDAPIQVQ